MAQPRNKAVIAGLAAALTLGGVTLPAMATTSNSTPATDSDPNGMGTPLPSGYDKADYYEGTEGVPTFASARSASSLSPVALTDEMKYFTRYESGCNYDKGLSSGDGYNAMGYYQFDRRYALVPFLRQVYAYDSETYGMFAPVLAQASTLMSESYSMYDYTTRQLTALAQQLDEAWHAAYVANPTEFSALQDSYAYNNYYLPVQSMLLNNYGVDLRNRADCVKGLAWGMCNLFGQGGVEKFFKGAGLSNDMTDRELVSALCDTVVNRVAEWYPSQPQYHKGWQNRYIKEKATCLKYLEQHEAEQGAGTQQGDAPSANGPSAGTPSAGDSGFGSTGSEPGSDAQGSGDASSGGASQQPSTPPQADGGSGSGSNEGAGSDADAGSADSDSTGGSTQGGTANGVTQQPVTPPATNGGGASDGSTSTGNSATADNSTSTDDSDAHAGGSSDSDSKAEASTDESPTDGGQAAGKGDAEDASDDVTRDDSQEKSDDAGTDSDGTTSSDAGAGNDAKKATESGSTIGNLPVTGDDLALVVTGAAGLAVAGASFLSLAKKEKDVE